MGQNCCVKDSTSTTETQVAYVQGPAEGSVVPVPKLRNPEYSAASSQVAADERQAPQSITTSDTYVNAVPAPARDDQTDYHEVPTPPSPPPPKSSPPPPKSEFAAIEGTWFFVANGKEAGTIGLDGFLTFHNGMTGQLSKAAGKHHAFTLTTQPDAIIEIVSDANGEDQLHWTDGNFSAYWSRAKPQGFAEYAGMWVRQHDGKNMVRINGKGLVEWTHDGGPVNPNSTWSNGHSEVAPGSVFQLQALQQRARGEITFTMKSISGDAVFFTVVAPSKTELRFESSTLQGLVLIRKPSGL